MTAPFECEVRFSVPDVEAFRRTLTELGGTVRFEYAFTDHYYQPMHSRWDPHLRALRIREHLRPPSESEVLLTANQTIRVGGLTFKRSVFSLGKVPLHTGTLPACRQVVDTLGFRPWIVVRKRQGELYEIPALGELVIEDVEGLGWMCEVEVDGDDPTRAGTEISEVLRLLGVSPYDATPAPVAALVDDHTHRRPGGRIYFCGAIRGGRSRQPLYAAIVSQLQSRGYEVLTTHVGQEDVLEREWRPGVRAEDIHARDLRWLAECDIVVAEVSTPSLGVGVEIAESLHLGKPVICLCQADVSLSAMIEGNQALRMIRYTDESDLFDQLSAALQKPTLGSSDASLGTVAG